MKTRHQDQSGFASIIIAITLVIVTSLIVVGFSRLARDEQNSVTDRQLSAQATYAAESGINDATKALSEGYDKLKVTCEQLPIGSSGPGEKFLTNNNVDGVSADVEYPCLLIDPYPKTLEYSPLSTVTPRVFQFSGREGLDITKPIGVSSIKFSWQDSSASKTTPAPGDGLTPGSFPAVSAWNYMSMVRVSVTPMTSLSRANLRTNTFVAYLYPSTSNTNRVLNHTSNIRTSGQVMNGGCSSTGNVTPGSDRLCSATINLSGFTGPYLVTMRSIYSKANISVSINNGNDRLAGAQAKVDSTGRSQDVLKRIQVRIPTKNVYDYPGFSVESAGDICKDLTVTPTKGDSKCY